MPTCKLLIRGKVQGVFYRATAGKVAEELGVTGRIRNTPDGQVAAIVSGTEEAVAQFITWCRQGPPDARVDDVSVTAAAETPFEGFSIER